MTIAYAETPQDTTPGERLRVIWSNLGTNTVEALTPSQELELSLKAIRLAVDNRVVPDSVKPSQFLSQQDAMDVSHRLRSKG